jgi:histidinol-phosphate aminotransferase
MISTGDITTLARRDVRGLPLYAPDVTPCAIDVSDNVNLWGTPPAALRALTTTAASASRYPSVYATPLRDAALRYLGLSSDGGIDVVSACGSDDVLDATMRAFGEPGDEIVFAAPTFVMIPILARLNGLVPVAVPMTSDYEVDPQQLVDRRAKITYLCSPNNPTSTALSRERVEYVVRNAAGLVVIDEAYAEFAREGTPSALTLLPRYPGLVVTRTMSKAFAMAGARIGYLAAAPEVVEKLLLVRLPYHLSAVTQAVARAALALAAEPLATVAKLRTERDGLVAWLRQRGLSVADSDANFVLFGEFESRRAVWQGLLDRGVLVREVGPPRWLRVTVGTPDEMAAFRAALDEVLSS